MSPLTAADLKCQMAAPTAVVDAEKPYTLWDYSLNVNSTTDRVSLNLNAKPVRQLRDGSLRVAPESLWVSKNISADTTIELTDAEAALIKAITRRVEALLG